MTLCRFLTGVPSIPFHPLPSPPDHSSDSRGEICVLEAAFWTPASFRFFIYQPVLLHLFLKAAHSPPTPHHAAPILSPKLSLPLDFCFPSAFSDILTFIVPVSGDILLCPVSSSHAGEGLPIEQTWPTLSLCPCPRTWLLTCSSLAVGVTSAYLCQDPLCPRELWTASSFKHPFTELHPHRWKLQRDGGTCRITLCFSIPSQPGLILYFKTSALVRTGAFFLSCVL